MRAKTDYRSQIQISAGTRSSPAHYTIPPLEECSQHEPHPRHRSPRDRSPRGAPRASVARRVSPQWHLWVDSLPPKGAIGWKTGRGDVTVMRQMSAADWLVAAAEPARARATRERARATRERARASRGRPTNEPRTGREPVPDKLA